MPSAVAQPAFSAALQIAVVVEGVTFVAVAIQPRAARLTCVVLLRIVAAEVAAAAIAAGLEAWTKSLRQARE